MAGRSLFAAVAGGHSGVRRGMAGAANAETRKSPPPEQGRAAGQDINERLRIMAKEKEGTGEVEMTFWGHLEELRWTLFRVVAALFVCLIACFCAMPYLFDHVILAPTTSDFFLYRWLASWGGDNPLLPNFSDGTFRVEIININVASQFLTHISTSFWCALLLVFPYLVFEIWRFVQPALFANERKSVAGAFIGGTFMFFLGCGRLYARFPFYVPVPDRIPAQFVDRQPDLAELLHGELPDADLHDGDCLRTAAAGVAALENGPCDQRIPAEIPPACRRRIAAPFGRHYPFGGSLYADGRFPAALPAL